MKASVFTLGCKVNECESGSLIEGLSRLGYEVSDELVPADVFILNTCAVRVSAGLARRRRSSSAAVPQSVRPKRLRKKRT